MEKYEKTRNSNIELLRILCIIAIILHHSFVHSHINVQVNNINYILLYLIQILGRVANNIFIIITGYYMINKKIKAKSIVKLVAETIFYSYSILMLYLILEPNKNITMIIKSIFPILTNSEWFITNYLLLYITIPFINILVNNLDKKQLSKLIIILVLCFSILPTITLLKEYFSCYIWFICLYLIGGYFKLYDHKEIKEKSYIILLVSIISLIFFMLFVMYSKNTRFIVGDINNFMLFILSISIFISFIKRKEWHNSNINYIASSVFGIYLIHDNIIVSPLLWNVLNVGKYIESNFFWVYEICIIAFVFCLCLIIDKIRQRFIEKPFLTFIYNKMDKIEKK